MCWWICILTLNFLGLTCNLVASVCPEEELQECPKGPDDKFVTNEEDLDKLCRYKSSLGLKNVVIFFRLLFVYCMLCIAQNFIARRYGLFFTEIQI